jgi:hypothetical protein
MVNMKPLTTKSSHDTEEPLLDDHRNSRGNVHDDLERAASQSPEKHKGPFGVSWMALHIIVITLYTTIFAGFLFENKISKCPAPLAKLPCMRPREHHS